MVYAVWAARRDVVQANPAGVRAALEALVAARAWGYANPEAVISAAQTHVSRPAGFYAAYFATLNFELDERALLGLGRFADELAALGAIPARRAPAPEVDFVTR
jgi:predicted solute-binding protein